MLEKFPCFPSPYQYHNQITITITSPTTKRDSRTNQQLETESSYLLYERVQNEVVPTKARFLRTYETSLRQICYKVEDLQERTKQ